MINDLSIRNVVLIDRLDMTFDSGLGVLTGETGAGKSILLDAMGLALGARADARLVRHGADQASVTARFALSDAGEPIEAVLSEHDIDSEPGEILLRRTLTPDGRSRAFINDQPVSVSLLRRIGGCLVEIQGQFDQHGLMDPASHIDLLDQFARAEREAAACADAFKSWRAAGAELSAAREAASESKAQEAFLRHSVEELSQLAPETGEEKRLDEERAILRNAERITEAVSAATAALMGGATSDGGGAAQAGLGAASRALAGAAPMAGGALDEALAAVDRALIEVDEAAAALNRVAAQIDAGGGALEALEERLFALRDAARKHAVAVDALPDLLADFSARLDLIESGDDRLAALEAAEAETRRGFIDAADQLTAARTKAALGLDGAVSKELPPLKLDRARFHTEIEAAPESDWSARGRDRVRFLVATNPGAPPGPIDRIASGGELSRFLLALKVTLAETGGAPTIIFDEVDSGVGGATAAAVGSRLERLAAERQILVVTHSPQVAALGAHHLRVAKGLSKGAMITAVESLSPDQRLEEVARMLSGEEITGEARAAAKQLLRARAAA